MRCISCNKILTNNDLYIDDELCQCCLSISNEARVELEQDIKNEKTSSPKMVRKKFSKPSK